MMKNVIQNIQRVPCLLLLMSFACLSASAQFQIKGTIVSDRDSEPMIGVSILEKGTNNGTITDIDGNYSLYVQGGNAVLEVSYIGYVPQTIQIDGRNIIDIQMKEDTELLDEVVVIGYGTMRKKDLTGSVAQIRPDALANKPPRPYKMYCVELPD